MNSIGTLDKLTQKVLDSAGTSPAKRLVRGARRCICNTSQARAREIMGRKFFGIEDAIKHFGVSPSKARPRPTRRSLSLRSCSGGLLIS